MLTTSENERVAVFIDFEFFLNGLTATCPGHRHDFQKIVRKLVAPGRLTRAWCYTAPPPPYLDFVTRQKRERFVSTIGNLPFFDMFVGKLNQRTRKVVPVGDAAEVLESCWQEFWEGRGGSPRDQAGLIKAKYWEQKGVDVKIAIDMMAKAHRNEYDTAVLVSGDGDFVEMLKLVMEMGKHAVIATCPNNPGAGYFASRFLKKTCDYRIEMNARFLADCRLPPRAPPSCPAP